MKFGKLTISNFLALGEAEVDLADRGLILIQGINEDEPSATSNGAAKSSIGDALSWACFGKTARGAEGDDIVNSRTKGGTCVSVQIIEPNAEYRITRYRKHKVGKNRVELHQVSPAFQDMTGGTDKITQEAIVNLIGCSYEVFVAAIYAGQEQFPDLPGATDKALKVLVEEAAGVERLELAYRVALDRKNKAEREFDYAQQTVATLLQKQIETESRITAIKSRMADYDAQTEAEVARLRKEAADLFDQAKNALLHFDPAVVAELQAGLYSIDQKLAGFKALQGQERSLLQELNKAEQVVTSVNTSIKHVESRIASTKHDIQHLDQKVGTPCRECGKPYEAHDLSAAREALTKNKLASLESQLNELGVDLQHATEGADRASKALADFRATLPDPSELNALRGAIEAKLNGMMHVRDQAENLEQSGHRAIDRANQLVQQPNPHKATLEAEESALSQCLHDIVASQQLLTANESALLLASAGVQVFSPAGVRAQILDTVTPFLNDRTASYLGTLSDGNIQAEWSTLTKTAKGELREKFGITVTNATGGNKFKLISGGEKRKARLATAMALQDLVASRATKPIEFFFADEIDAALDEAGVERLMTVLEEKARDRGTLLCVSHNPLSAIRETLTVCKRNGIATILN
jgi:DNA repair exonuclease SbcCD ATPase subunit